MRPGRLTPENPQHGLDRAVISVASMRPGRLTPENRPPATNISEGIDPLQ